MLGLLSAFGFIHSFRPGNYIVLIPQPADNRLSALPHVMRGSKRQLPVGISVLLIHHYIAAFGELHGQGQSPEGAWELRVLCNVKGNLTM
jgi:hypothetical protein